MRRRTLMSAGLLSALACTAAAASAASAHAQAARAGPLLIAGGAMDLRGDKAVLRRFVELSGGSRARIRVIAAASANPQAAWSFYGPALAALGVGDCTLLDLPDRDTADDPATSEQLLQASGVFLTGGDQNRLMARLWETRAMGALHTAHHLQGCCIGGTSAGAAVMSRHMLAQGEAVRLPEKEVAALDLGLGLVHTAIIDQHFSERGRLGRLLSAVAQRPQVLGVGIDEDTALVIERGRAIEVVGQGAVTVVDGRQMRTNADLIDARERLEMLGVRLHLLPAGYRYSADPEVQQALDLPPSLRDVIGLLVAPGPIRA